MIRILSKETIDRISAGEVVERPSGVVKELVENSIDSGANAITVEVKGGGCDMIRVTDNGSGISRDEIATAFLRHATSKIENSEDLNSIVTLGFRGEALASICAVSETEMITKIPDSVSGNRMLIRGGEEISFEEIGAPTGTTVIVRNLFFNTPARKKFLKTNSTEGSYVSEIMERIALSHPEISFQVTVDGRTKFHTSGSGDLLEVIFRVYGREIAGGLVPISAGNDMFSMSGYIGKPEIVRSNRNMELYFLNGRYVRNNLISSAIEEGYREYLMLHKFPIAFLYFGIDPEKVDVNVHPSKLDVRISEQNSFVNFVQSSIHDVLKGAEMIPENILTSEAEKREFSKASAMEVTEGKNPEPFEVKRSGLSPVESTVRAYSKAVNPYGGYSFEPASGSSSEVNEDFFFEDERKPLDVNSKASDKPENENADVYEKSDDPSSYTPGYTSAGSSAEKPSENLTEKTAESLTDDSVEKPAEKPADKAADFLEKAVFRQTEMFEDHLLDRGKRDKYVIIGQVFDTYWIVQYEQKMFIIDQHAAHEKVNYERMLKRIRNGEHPSQMVAPPVLVTLSASEERILNDNIESFEKIGFEVEHFGGSEYAIRGVPTDLFGHSEKELLLAVLEELATNPGTAGFKTIDEKIAGMACKASVKGGDRIGFEQAQNLIDELLTLDNPYNCPHGRPTIITITKAEMEKKFKRIVD